MFCCRILNHNSLVSHVNLFCVVPYHTPFILINIYTSKFCHVILISDPKITLLRPVVHVFFWFISPIPGWNMGVPGFDVTYTTYPRPACYCRFYTAFFFPPFSWRPVEERMGNSDVINLGTAGQRSMQTLRVPRFVPMCLCPVDGEIDGVVLPACAAPASQHADWSVWSCGMSPSAPQSHSPLLVWMPITGRKIVI